MMRSVEYPHEHHPSMDPKESARSMSRSQKALELRKYFSPTEPQSGHNDRSPFNERINADGALTSYAENALWRLGAVRCMASLVDRDTQYFIAGVKRIGNFGIESDAQWFGHDHISLSGRPCEHAIDLTHDDETSCFVVQDLGESPEWSKLSFVNGELASYRFYAGTPITTSLGVNIGIFHIYDDKPRPGGLDSEQTQYLRTLASNVMHHLEIHREAAERKRVALMSKGISNFLEKTSRVTHNDDGRMKDGAKPRSNSEQQASASRSHAEPDLDQSVDDAAKGNIHPSSQTLDKIKTTLDHAAEILKEALELTVGGVVFLDVKRGYRQPGTTNAFADSNTDLGAIIDEQKACDDGREEKAKRPTMTQASQSPSNGNSKSNTARVSYSCTANEQTSPAKVLAMSTADTARWDTASHVMDGKTLQTFMNLYPQGNVWYIDEEGHFSSLEQANGEVQRKENGSQSSMRQRKRRESNTDDLRRRAEASLLTKVFEGARQVVFVPLWDAGSDRWYSGCFVWSKSAVPVFTVDSEISFLSAFTNSLMVEISRLDAITANKMKSDFISSISHEFRSPLHGILASAEFLQESKLEASQSEFVSTIQNCGSTLLDTINHVLDYSKINSFESSVEEGIVSSELYRMCNIALLCEEVVNGMVAAGEYQGTQHSRAPSGTNTFVLSNRFVRAGADRKRPVEVTLDFEHRDWNFTILSGALRRIIMNIFGNAQKYTSSGFILVQLRVREATDEDHSSRRKQKTTETAPSHMMTINIVDSGCGMSTDYMERRLFTSFAQEDSLSAGVGLGLSIVRSIIAQLDGQIQIRSETGKGTDVEITIPLRTTKDEGANAESAGHDDLDTPQHTQYSFASITELARGKSVAICSQSDANADGTKSATFDSLRRYCSEWFGFNVINPAQLSELLEVDLVIAEERYAGTQSAKEALLKHKNRLLLVRNSSIWVKDDEAAGANKSLSSIQAPLGPFKLARSILSIFERPVSDDKSSTVESSKPRAEVATQVEVPEVSISDNPGVKIDSVGQGDSISTNLVDANNSLDRPGLRPTSTVQPNLPSNSTSEATGLKANQLALPFRLSQRSISAPVTGAQTAAEEPSGLPLRLLAVDDNDVNLQLIYRFLAKRKIDIIEIARNGCEALEAVKRLHASSNGSKQFDIIFMDISMPVMDGFEATACIREFESQIIAVHSPHKADQNLQRNGQKSDPSRNQTLIVALTGLGSKRDRDRADECGFDEFMTKPVSFKKVGDLVARVSQEATSRLHQANEILTPSKVTPQIAN